MTARPGGRSDDRAGGRSGGDAGGDAAGGAGADVGSPTGTAAPGDRIGRRAWLGVALALATVAVLGHGLPAEAIDWQPGRALAQPWRLVTPVGVHYGASHLAANLAGLALTGVLGVVARPPLGAAIAWLLAWPATQGLLSIEPGLLHYGGLSGVLHAGVAVIATLLVVTGTRAQRVVGAALALGLVAKLGIEAPWGAPLRRIDGWAFPVAPLAHATGAFAGALAMLAVLAAAPRRHADD